MTEPQPLQQINRTYVRYRGRTLSYFSGCDYFRLASHPAVLQALRDGLSRYGLNVAASRRTTGEHQVYQTLEKDLAKFFHAEAALLLSSGYVTNLAVAQALKGQFSHALMDERAHVALQDAAQFLNCPVVRFQHRDVKDCERNLRRCGRGARPVLLTDGMIGHDGSVSPLRSYLKLLPRDGLVIVDDAHGAGTLGNTGGGAIEFEGVSRARVVQCVTLSKAFGTYGGAVICSRSLRERIVAHSPVFVGSTPLPLPLAHAVITALRIVRTNTALRHRLNRNAAYVKDRLRAFGFVLPAAPGPLVPIHFHNAQISQRLQRALLGAGILPPWVKYPGGPASGYFRFAIASEHRRPQLETLVNVLKPFAPEVAAHG